MPDSRTVVETTCETAMSLVLGDLHQRPRQVGAASLRVFIFGGAFEYRVSMFRVKTLGLTFSGCTW